MLVYEAIRSPSPFPGHPVYSLLSLNSSSLLGLTPFYKGQIKALGPTEQSVQRRT